MTGKAVWPPRVGAGHRGMDAVMQRGHPAMRSLVRGWHEESGGERMGGIRGLKRETEKQEAAKETGKPIREEESGPSGVLNKAPNCSADKSALLILEEKTHI